MYRLNIKKENFGDIIVLFLFNKLFDEKFMESSELFNELGYILNKKGVKSKIFQMYFNTDSNIRSRYKQFEKMISSNDDVSINISDTENGDYKKIIECCVKSITKKEKINEEKLELFIKDILSKI